MSTANTPRPASGLIPDLVIGTGVTILFVTALLGTMEWPFRTALFPRIVTVAGIVFGVAFVAIRVAAHLRDARRAPAAGDSGLALADEDAEHDQELEYVYATAGGAAWAQALGWIALFFVFLLAGGLFAAAALFSVAYLRWAGRQSWRLSLIYAVVLTGVLYLFLQLVLTVPVPESLFLS